MIRFLANRRYLLPAIVALLNAGCATPLQSPTAPSVASDRAGPLAISASGGMGSGVSAPFFPLQVGNHWSYHRRAVFTTISDGEIAIPPTELNATVDRDQICVETRATIEIPDGIDYVVEQVTEQYPGYTTLSWVRNRQDRSGLYEADALLSETPVCGPTEGAPSRVSDQRSGPVSRFPAGMEALLSAAPPGRQAAYRAAIEQLRIRLACIDAALHRPVVTPAAALAASGELTRLSYPLYTGKGWTIRSGAQGGPYFARVEGADVLDLPAGRLRGFRIRITSAFFGPDDEVRVWYGPSGLLQVVTHTVVFLRDEAGPPFGRMALDQRETLTEMSLVREPFAGTLLGGGLLGRD
jgi:hypothetical protein